MKFDTNSALIVIDMQNDGLIHPKSANRGNNDVLIQRVNHCIKMANEQHLPIINVIHTVKNTFLNRLIMKNRFIAHTEGAKLHHGVFGDMTWDIEVGKSVGSAFSNPILSAFLKKKSIEHIYIVGLDAKFCVQATAKSAVENGYTTTILTDLVLTHNQEEVMPKLIEQYKSYRIHIQESNQV